MILRKEKRGKKENMTIIIEINKPFQKKPGYCYLDICKRVWWLWFAVAYTSRRYDEIIDKRKYKWIEKAGRI